MPNRNRRTVSLPLEVHDAAEARARDVGISLSQYVSELVASDLRSVGVAVPEAKHRPRTDVPRIPRLVGDVQTCGLCRARGHNRRRCPQNPPAPKPAKPAPVTCSWCGTSARTPVATEHGPAHPRCAEQRRRVEAKHPPIAA